jgi:hypothetical protein
MSVGQGAVLLVDARSSEATITRGVVQALCGGWMLGAAEAICCDSRD